MAAFVSFGGGLGLLRTDAQRKTCSRVVACKTVESPYDGASFPPSFGGGNNKANGGGNGRGRDNGGDGDSADDDGAFKGMGALWAAYMAALEVQPLLVKCTSAFALACVGDIMAQYIEAGRESVVNWKRTISMGVTAAVIAAPMFHFLYEFMELYFPASLAKRNVFYQLFIDQLIAAPLYIPLFYAIFGSLEGKDLRNISTQVNRDFWPTMKLTWYIWPLVQLANFTLLPVKTRILTINVVDIFFNTALSLISHQ